MKIMGIRHAWPENAGFLLNRINGHKNYTFLHFFNSVEILVDNKIVKTMPNACIIYSPGVRQWFKSDGNLTHNWMHADDSFGLLLKKYNIKENTIFYTTNASFITDLFMEMETEWLLDNEYRDDILLCKIKEFLIKLARSRNPDNIAPIQKKYFTEYSAIRREIILNLDRRWTVTSMAELASISPSRFFAIYKNVFGTSPLKDLISARINAAKNLLLSGNENICCIAKNLGYSNQYHFSRQFKKETGFTPTEYRDNFG